MYNKIIMLLLLLIALPLGAREIGAGGLIMGKNISEDPEQLSQLENNFIGGYGYGTLHDGQRIGGYFLFGSSEMNRDMLFSFGMLTGKEFSHRSLRLGCSLLFGPAFLNLPADDPNFNPFGNGSRFAFFAEGDLEGGILVFPFMQIVAYGGMQFYGDFGSPHLSTFVPVGGVKIIWGAF